jgi:heptosyltransferase-1
MYNADMGNRSADSPGTRILVVRLGAMGDIIHALPAVASLKHSFPNSHLTWVVETKWAPLLQENPFIDRVALFDRTGPGSLWRSCRALRSQSYDFAVDFQGLIKSALLTSVARPDRIYGFHHSAVRERPAALFYSSKVQTVSAHKVEQNLELAAATGASNLLRKFALPAGTPAPDLPAGDFILASPLAGWRAKQWPLEYYEALARCLKAEFAIPLVLNVPAEARKMLAQVPAAIPSTTNIAELIAATRRAVAVVGVDSGPMHLAAALGKPGVAIFGPTDPAANGPYGETFTVLRSPNAVTSYKRLPSIDPSMRDITPDQVFCALKVHLARRRDCLV